MPSRLLSFVTVTCVAFPATAQARIQAGIGLAASSALVEDFIVGPITVRPALAPTLSLSADWPLGTGYRLGLGASVARSMVKQHTGDLSEDIVTLSVWQPTVRVSRTVGQLELGARGGLHIYQPAQPIGLFSDGGTTTASVGADAGLPGFRVGALRLGLHADWMVARFSTTTLREFGFRGRQIVHRFGLRATVTGGPRAP
jgi:hypothetical protein